MEDHKIMYLQQFLGHNSLVSLEDLINIIKENETKLRDSYAETIDLSRKDFATMILLDAVFIIMVLLKMEDFRGFYESGRSDHIFYRPFKLVDVLFDMSLLENQLPFFIVQKLFERFSGAANPEINCTLTELTCDLFKGLWPDWVKEDSWKIINPSGVLHFVDFLQKCQQPTEEHRPAKKEVFLSAPTATELHQSGVKFKRSDKSPLLDITFNNGILEIPQLKIYDVIEILFRNLQAFEQCHHGNGDTFVNDYITFISCLVSATKDVEVLAQNENLKNMLSSDETVSNLFHNLVIENATSSESFLSGLCEELNLHCKKRRHKWKANLKQVYFNNPWTGISVGAATFLLVLTFIQTVCSILQL
jgi:hypothetical protein